MKRNSICLDRTDIETYKTKCDVCCADKIAAEGALQEALDSNINISWYQQKPVALTAEVLVILSLLRILVIK